MSIFTKLIFKDWIRFFLASMVVLLLLVSMGNLIAGMLRGSVTATEVFLNYFIEIPDLILKIIPISCLVSSLFTVNKLKNRNELIAMFASGMSRFKFISTIAIISSVIAGFEFSLGAYIKPFIQSKKSILLPESLNKFDNLKGQGLNANAVLTGKAWFKGENYFCAFSTYDKEKLTLNNVLLMYFDNNYLLEKKITAKKAISDGTTKWVLDEGKIYNELNTKSFPSMKEFKNLELILNESPKDFLQIESDINVLDIEQLRKYIKKLDQAGINTSEYEAIFWNIFSNAIICVIFALLAIISIFNPSRRNSSLGKNIAFIFIFTILYWLVYSYFYELGKSSKIPTFIASFIVPTFFSIYIFHYFFKYQTLKRNV